MCRGRSSRSKSRGRFRTAAFRSRCGAPTDGGAPRLATTVAAYYDDDFLTVVFDAEDDEIVATYLGHDEPLWQEDVVEIFLAPEGLTPYFEIEVNPLGTTFDARIDSPDGVRATMTTDLAWTCEGLFAALRRDDGNARADRHPHPVRLAAKTPERRRRMARQLLPHRPQRRARRRLQRVAADDENAARLSRRGGVRRASLRARTNPAKSLRGRRITRKWWPSLGQPTPPTVPA